MGDLKEGDQVLITGGLGEGKYGTIRTIKSETSWPYYIVQMDGKQIYYKCGSFLELIADEVIDG